MSKKRVLRDDIVLSLIRICTQFILDNQGRLWLDLIQVKSKYILFDKVYEESVNEKLVGGCIIKSFL